MHIAYCNALGLGQSRIVSGDRRFCYLPNFTDYQSSVGDVGLVAELVESEQLSDGRWNLAAKMVERITVEETWVEAGTGHLHYVGLRVCACCAALSRALALSLSLASALSLASSLSLPPPLSDTPHIRSY